MYVIIFLVLHFIYLFIYFFIRGYFNYLSGPLHAGQQSSSEQCYDIAEGSKGRPCGFGVRWWPHCKHNQELILVSFLLHWWTIGFDCGLLRSWRPIGRVSLLLLVMSSTPGLFVCPASMRGEQAIMKRCHTDGRIFGRFAILNLCYGLSNTP